MQNVLVYTNIDKDKRLEITSGLIKILEGYNKNIFVNFRGACGIELKKECIELSQVREKNIDTIIALGGDGTILGLARDVYEYEIPIIGINLGRVGFLAEVEVSHIDKIVEKLINGDYEVEDRMMLAVKIKSKEQEKSIVGLNDIVINRGSFSRMIELEIHVDKGCAAKYFADGVIVSTPTGSTAYNLSAGGPILMPDMRVMTITPVCPHSLTARPIVASSRHKLLIKLRDDIQAECERPMITIDGQKGIELAGEDEVFIEKADKSTKLIRLKGISYYDILRRKLH